jgi:hypothetical protein
MARFDELCGVYYTGPHDKHHQDQTVQRADQARNPQADGTDSRARRGTVLGADRAGDSDVRGGAENQDFSDSESERVLTQVSLALARELGRQAADDLFDALHDLTKDTTR